ncbi:hypothetical protein GGR54DRAFT_647727 [Hypoxylon sp. NC1633]|nr:hypothetical protein GGR54DRAFT_647727 [Hypoxylon sp. NC1633]
MLVDLLVLFCVVVYPTHGQELVNSKEYRHGRFNKRISSRNESVTVVATSSLGILSPSIAIASSETNQGPVDVVSITTTTTTSTSDDAVVAVSSSEDNTASSEPGGWWTIFNLGTITTLPRPTLALPSSTLTRSQSSVLTQTTVSSSNTSLDTSPGTIPPTSSSFVFNTTSKPWSLNTTSSVPSSTVDLLPPTTLTSTLTVTSTPSECSAHESGRVTVTSYSIIYTSTTTWTGDPADYTPPYPPISTPTPCTPQSTPTGRFTLTFCDSTGKTCSFIQTTTGIDPSTTNNLFPPTPDVTQTVTMITTDKNPAVVFPTQTPPSYGGSPSNPQGHHSAEAGEGPVSTPEYGMLPTTTASAKSSPTPTSDDNVDASPGPPTGDAAAAPPGAPSGASPEPTPDPTPITVIVQPGEVIIDDHTFVDSPTQKTSTVVVGSETFIIEPSRVIGVGVGASVTISRPPSNAGGVFMPTPTPTPTPITTTIGGVGVVYGYGSSVATIDGTAFTIEPTPTVVVIKGETITLGPEGLIFPSETLHAAAGSVPVLPVPGLTQTAVMGGELITVLGPSQVVIEGTTLAYGPDASSTLTTVIDGDTVLVAPAGVVVHNRTIGGSGVAGTGTTYEVVGGATVTQMGLTAVEISGVTFRVGYGYGNAATPITTVVGGHTLTIGPDGVGMSTWTLGAPYASTATLLVPGLGPGAGLGSSNNAAMSIPTATGKADNENAGLGLRPGRDWGLLVLGVGVGVMAPWGFWL